MLARALAQQAPVMMLDEATSQLDMGHKRSICVLLKHLCHQGKTIVQVSHDMNSAAEISHKILLLDASGRQLGFGTPQEVLNVSNIETAYGVEVDIEHHPCTGQLRFLPRPLTGLAP
jgi:iron complex transport system ATP-binding protein